MKVYVRENSYNGNEKEFNNVKNVKMKEDDDTTGIIIEYEDGSKRELEGYGVYDADKSMTLVEIVEKKNGKDKRVYNTVVGYWRDKDDVLNILYVKDGPHTNSRTKLSREWRSMGEKIKYELFDKNEETILEEKLK